jgi:hypothetical protein
MMINCKESSLRTSELRDHRIRGVRKLELWFHLVICKFCRIYNNQIQKLGRISRLIGDATCGSCGDADAKSGITLPADAKARIKDNLRAK